MWRLLIPLALWLGTARLGRAELTAAQHRSLQVALEEFHKHPRVQWAFRETSVDSATDTVSSTAQGGEGVGPHPRTPAQSQEASATVLGLWEHQALRRKTTTPATSSDVLFHCGDEGQITSRNCPVRSAGCWPSSVCLSVGSPSWRGPL